MFFNKIKSLYYHLHFSTISLFSHIVPTVITPPLVFLTFILELLFLFKFVTPVTFVLSIAIAFFIGRAFYCMHGDSVQHVNASAILKRLEFDDFYGMIYVDAEEIYGNAHVSGNEISDLWQSDNGFFSDSFAFVFIHSPFGVRVYAHKDFIRAIKLTDCIVEAISEEANKKLVEFRMNNPASNVNVQSSWME